MNGIRMAAGSERDLSLPRGRTTIPVGLALDNERIPAWWVSHVRRGERTTVRTAARVNASVLGRTVTAARTDETTFETDIAGRFDTSESRPVDAGLPVVPDPLFVVERTNATWGRVSSEETPLNATFVLANPRDFPLPIVAFEYAVSMNGVRVGNGATEGGVVPPGGRRAIAARTVIENDRLDEWWVSHVRRGQRTDVRIEFAARIELPTGGVVRVALDEFTYTDTFETDVFGADGADDATEIRATGGGIDRAVSPAAG
jgi:LEA14-like dessication related protein